MIVLDSQAARLVARGRKTQHRRPAKPDARPPWRPGRSYAVVPNGAPAKCRVVLLEVETQLAGDLTFDDARAEGYRTREEWKAAWIRRHDRAWVDRQTSYDDHGEVLIEPADELLFERFDARHAERAVWALFFELDRGHVPRLLHRQSERGYTTNPRDAVPDEPEAVDAATLTRYAKKARERDTARGGYMDQRALQEAETLEAELATIRRLGRARGVDLRDDERVIRRRIAAMARKVARVDA